MFMNAIAELFAIFVVFAFTYVLFSRIGLKRDTLFFSKAEKMKFDGQMSGSLGRFATVTTIFGSLTSLATVYVFFVGTSKVVGIFAFATLVSLFLGSFVTNYFTKLIMSQPYPKSLYENAEQLSAVFASLFWQPNTRGRAHAACIKYITIFNIIAVLWLEFAVLADLTGAMGFPDTLLDRSAVFFCGAFAICLFIFRFGLRGFVFADMLQAPVIAIASLVVLAAICYAVFGHRHVDVWRLAHPLDPKQALFFVCHVFVANSFLVLVTEGHWMRVWLYGQREDHLQVPAISWTIAGWTVLVIVGLIAGVVTKNVGYQGVADLLTFTEAAFPPVIVVFWIAAIAALFSTVDANIFNLLLVSAFDPKSGQLSGSLQRPKRVLALSTLLSFAGAILYFVVRWAQIPLEKLVFILIPLCLNNLPAIVSLSLGRQPRLSATVISLIGYSIVAIAGILQQDNYSLALSSALVPLLVGTLTIMLPERAISHRVTITRQDDPRQG
jgi:hypothetical protein